MAMNCKQFKHPQRVEKKQQFSFNPAEVNYDTSEKTNNKTKSEKLVVRDTSPKKLMRYFLILIAILSAIIFFSSKS